MTAIQAVFFDVGETIVDETREYGTGPTGSASPDTPSRPSSER